MKSPYNIAEMLEYVKKENDRPDDNTCLSAIEDALTWIVYPDEPDSTILDWITKC